MSVSVIVVDLDTVTPENQAEGGGVMIHKHSVLQNMLDTCSRIICLFEFRRLTALLHKFQIAGCSSQC